MDGAQIRKPIDKLTIADLERFAVWEYAIDEEGLLGQDETTVRPADRRAPLKFEPGTIVRATAKLADGTKLASYVAPVSNVWLGVDDVQPVIVCRAGQIGFWFGAVRPGREELDRYYAMLGKGPAEIFPLTFVPSVPFVRGVSSCVVDAFYYLENGKTAAIA